MEDLLETASPGVLAGDSAEARYPMSPVGDPVALQHMTFWSDRGGREFPGRPLTDLVHRPRQTVDPLWPWDGPGAEHPERNHTMSCPGQTHAGKGSTHGQSVYCDQNCHSVARDSSDGTHRNFHGGRCLKCGRNAGRDRVS